MSPTASFQSLRNEAHNHRPLLPAPHPSRRPLLFIAGPMEHPRSSYSQAMDMGHVYDQLRQETPGVVGCVLGAAGCEGGR